MPKRLYSLGTGFRTIGKVAFMAELFFLDPSGNALEFKSFKDMSQLFAA